MDRYRGGTRNAGKQTRGVKKADGVLDRIKSFKFTRKNTAIIIIIIVAIPIVFWLASLAGSIGEINPVTEGKFATFTIMDSSRGEDVTANYSLAVYINGTTEVLDVDDLVFFRNYNASINDSVADVSLGFDFDFLGYTVNRYVLKFYTDDMDGFGNFTVFWASIRRGGHYVINVYRDPDTTSIELFDDDRAPATIGTIGTDFWLDIVASNYTDASWARIYDLDFSATEYKMITLNLTFNDTIRFNEITGVMDIKILDEIISGLPGTSGTMLPFKIGDDWITYCIPFLNGRHEYLMSVNSSVSITSMTLKYGNDTLWVV